MSIGGRSEGVKYYTWGHASLAVPFPEEKLVCQWCPYVRNEDSLKRHKCLLTGEYLPYPFTSRGNECPVVFDEEEHYGEFEPV